MNRAEITQRGKEVLARLPIAPGNRFRRFVGPGTRPDMERVGTEYGGWSVPTSLIGESSVCYCGGVGIDVTFDLGLIERFGCTVFAFDPTPSSASHIAELGELDPRFNFLPVGIWSEDTTLPFYEPDYGDSNFSVVNLHGSEGHFDAPVRSLPSLMVELGHTRIDLLKLDIEGAEYEALKPVLAGDLRPPVLCVEFHKVDGMTMHFRTVRALREIGYETVALDKYDVTFVLAT